MRESGRVEGGSVYSVHVLFVNHPPGKRDTRLYSCQSTKGHKARSGGSRVWGNSICACMYVSGQYVSATEAPSIRNTQKGRQGRVSRGARKTNEGGILEK